MVANISTGLAYSAFCNVPNKSSTFANTQFTDCFNIALPQSKQPEPTKMILQPLEHTTRSRFNFNFDDKDWLNNTADMSNACSYISPDGKDIIGILSTVGINEPLVARKVSEKNANGTQISVSTILPPRTENDPKGSATYYYELSMVGLDGAEFKLDIKENVRITQTKEGNAVFYEKENVTRIYAADGSYTEATGDTVEKGIDSVYALVTTNSTLTTDDGNNTILICGSGAQVTAGKGNNTIFIHGYGAQISAGNGNNTILIHSDGAQVTAGNGNNTIIASNLHDAVINLGQGNNSAKVQEIYNTKLTLGDGDNNISVEGITGDSHIKAGNGNNTITGYSLGMWGEHNTASITLGNGDNKLEFHDIRGGSLSFGDGNNFIELYRILDNANLLVGNGNNIVSISEVGNQPSEYEAGSMGRLIFGDGDNRVQVVNTYFNSEMLFGNGNNTASIGQIHDNSKIIFGSGNNTMAARNLLHNSSLSFGKGENYVFIDSMLGSPQLYLGAGTAFTQAQMHQSTVLNASGSIYLGRSFTNPSHKKAEAALQRFTTADYPLLLPNKIELGFEKKYAS